jgi:hypothetical protein
MEKVNRENVAEHLLDFQLSLLGKTRVDIVNDDKFRFNTTIRREELMAFKKYAIPLLQKIFHFNKTKAKDTFDWWYMRFGVRVKG